MRLRTCRSPAVDPDSGCTSCTGTAPSLAVVTVLGRTALRLGPGEKSAAELGTFLAVLLSARLETRTKESKELACWMADTRNLSEAW